jgi:hypothetical protein
MIKFAAPLIMLAALAAPAQTLKIPESFDKLAAKAKEVVDIKLDANLLGLMAKSHSGKEAHGTVDVKNEGKIKGGFVRSYEFEQEGEYSQADVEALRSQLRNSGWSCMVNVRNNKSHETAQVCFHATDGAPDGLAIVAAEPKELTVINLVGTGDLSQLGSLGDQFHLSDMSFTNKK